MGDVEKKIRVLVIASGPNVREHLDRVNRDEFDAVIGVNQAAIDFGPVDYHCTLHPLEYAPKRACTWVVAHRMTMGVKEVFPPAWRHGGSSGSSGLYAVKYALQKLQADEVILAGVEITSEPHYYTAVDWAQAKLFQRTWIEVQDQLKGKVCSLGGWTAELLNNHFTGGYHEPSIHSSR